MRALLCACALLCASALAAAQDAPGPRITARALFEGQALLEIDGKQRVLKVGQRSPEGLTLLAADPRSARIEIGGEIHEIALDASIGTRYARAPEPRSLRLAPAGDGHYYVDGTINGTAVRFVVDTGATTIAINRRDARRIGLLYRVDGVPMAVETASGVTQAYRVTFRSVKARAIEVTNVEGMVIDGDFPSTALLGQSFLNRLDMQREGLLLELRER